MKHCESSHQHHQWQGKQQKISNWRDYSFQRAWQLKWHPLQSTMIGTIGEMMSWTSTPRGSTMVSPVHVHIHMHLCHLAWVQSRVLAITLPSWKSRLCWPWFCNDFNLQFHQTTNIIQLSIWCWDPSLGCLSFWKHYRNCSISIMVGVCFSLSTNGIGGVISIFQFMSSKLINSITIIY